MLIAGELSLGDCITS